MLLERNPDYGKISLTLIVVLVTSLLLSVIVYSAWTDAFPGWDPESGGGDDNGCDPAEDWSYHYDWELVSKPSIKVTITDEKYKVLNQEGNWVPLKFIFYIENYIDDNQYH